MADSMSVGSATTPKIDQSRWKKLTPQEIIKEKSKGEEIPAEILDWAEQMAAIARIPDDVTYEQVDGDVGLDALAKLGIEENPVGAQDENAIAPDKTEEPGAVKDVAQTSETAQETQDTEDKNIFITPPPPGQASDSKPTEEKVDQNNDLNDLANSKLGTDLEEIRKRKARRGLE